MNNNNLSYFADNYFKNSVHTVTKIFKKYFRHSFVYRHLSTNFDKIINIFKKMFVIFFVNLNL